MSEKYFLASDHAGFELKEKIKEYLKKYKLDFQDLGPKNYEPEDDYNDYAKKVVKKVKENKNHFGILVCGTGQGMSIQANRYSGIRCALCWNKEIARQAKEHLNANIISMPGKYIDIKTAKEIITAWRKTKTLTLEKHKRRINKLERLWNYNWHLMSLIRKKQ